MRTLMICAVVAIAGCASTPPSKPTAQNVVKPACLSTGSRIPQSQQDCIASGNSYSQQQIDLTGRTPEVGDALQMLNTSLISHH